LHLECEHFLECVTTRKQPRTSGESAVPVLQVLEACEESVRTNGMAVEIRQASPDYFAHPSAVIDSPCEIGEGTRIWHFSHLMADTKVGANCNLGQNVVIGPGVTIGNNVKIQNNVSVYTGVTLEDDVFCGPSMVFTNVLNPRSHIRRKHEFKRTLVRQGASLGANATVVCGVTLGRYCFVGAGTVVRKDVPDYALVVGVPARQIGWICYCGIRLQNVANPVCSVCDRRYSIADGVCRELDDSSPIPITPPESRTLIGGKIAA
jgi:UDP-2-acetamido-3-amino-2,3-dideoxy-glucuronate N-acetyltransferase